MNTDDEQTEEASGIFTMKSDGASLDRKKDYNSNDEGSEILTNFPGLDDEDDMSAIIADTASGGGDTSGVFTMSQATQSATGAVVDKGAAKSGGKGGSTEFDALYELDASTIGANTNDIVGQYGKSSSRASSGAGEASPAGSKSTGPKKNASWISGLTDTLQMMGLNIHTAPTADSTPDTKASSSGRLGVNQGKYHDELDREDEEDAKALAKSDDSLLTPDKRDASTALAVAGGLGASRASQGDEPPAAKICGLPARRVILICGCLVVLALIVIVASVVAVSNNDGGTVGGFPQGIFTISPTDATVPTLPPIAVVPTWAPSLAPVETGCVPDSEEASFIVDSLTVDCEWLRNQEDKVYKELLCDSEGIIAESCPTTCSDDCGTHAPTSVSLATAQPAASPTTAEPTIFLTTQFPTLSTTAPTSRPTGTPTLAPTGAPTRAPTSDPTRAPTSDPTTLPTPRPTLRPTPRPTASPTTSVPGQTNTPTVVVAPTQAPQLTTLQPTSSTAPAPCPPDLPGNIPTRLWTCSFLRITSSSFREEECAIDVVAEHCPNTCQSC